MVEANQQIPQDFTPFFWDVHMEQLEPAIHSRFTGHTPGCNAPWHPLLHLGKILYYFLGNGGK